MELVKSMSLTASFVSDAELQGKLFLGVLGLEYPIPYVNALGAGPQDMNIFTLPANGKPKPSKLHYNYINRTFGQDEFAYSDGILPVYLRFQPDLELPLNLAGQGTPSGEVYMSQYVNIDQPVIKIEGKEKKVDAAGAATYSDKVVSFSIPVNPPEARSVKLSLQDGLIAFLAFVR